MEIKNILTKQKPDAIFASDDLTAILIIKIAQELGLSVPDQLKVIGYDGTYFYREITTLTSLPLNNLWKKLLAWQLIYFYKKIEVKRLLLLAISYQLVSCLVEVSNHLKNSDCFSLSFSYERNAFKNTFLLFLS